MSDNIEDLYPLSPTQQGMLFHALLDPTGGAYVEQVTMVLEGEFHPEAFHRGWQAAVDRHPVLRTGLVWEKMPHPKSRGKLLTRIHRLNRLLALRPLIDRRLKLLSVSPPNLPTVVKHLSSQLKNEGRNLLTPDS